MPKILPCARNNCKNDKCFRKSKTYGYICDDCFRELVNKNEDIEIFMKSKKEEIPNSKYDKEFPKWTMN